MPAVTDRGLEVPCAAWWPQSILVHECGEDELWNGQGVLVDKTTPLLFCAHLLQASQPQNEVHPNL